MESFEYASPDSRKDAVKLLGSEWGQTEIMAGGTDLVSAMKDFVVTPHRVVSLKRIRDLSGVSAGRRDALRIGAMTTLRELMADDRVKKRYPALVQAADGIRSEQLRNMGTVGGELLQRPRCWYFRLGYGLLAQKDGKSMPREGDNRYHAILGNSGPACFVSPSSLAPALIALDAEVEAYGPNGTRRIPVDKLFSTPTQPGEREHTLHPSEILTEIVIPATSFKSATYEVRQKQEMDWPLAAAAVALQMEGKTVRHAQIVLGHVAPVPWVSPEAAKAIEGKTENDESADAAANAAVAQATPLSMNGYKVQLARVAVKRAIQRAAEGGA
ncbi:MAG: FAD binding domain-containing protein [Acidobacteriota bacterium]|nr:FAD binding domain-containing protein [Acidobacteriota bacterium]